MQDDLERISFAEWLIELNACAAKAGYKGDQPLVQMTGQLCWYSFYEEGLTPAAVLKIAATTGAEYGADYEEL
ncbi:MAG: hypothetical protein PHY92_00095 [Alphaproteobacteria bacterium]|nr:hypothetical protein [Alphaproteobacteria bacterium]